MLKMVWDNASLKEGYSYYYEMSDAMFYFYHIAHMAKHFELGGCGIKPFIDLIVLHDIKTKDISQRNLFLEQGGLLRFEQMAQKLSQIWFFNQEHTSLTMDMQNYVLGGGVYGSKENRIVLQQQKKGGKFKYILSRIFMPYNEIKYYYPILKKHKWLLPIMQVRRWFRLVFCGGFSRSKKEMKINSNTSKKQARQMQNLLKQLEL